MQKELNITIKCDGKTVTAEILEPESGDFVTIEESFSPDERNPDWRERVSNEIYSWVEMGMEHEQHCAKENHSEKYSKQQLCQG